MRSSYIAFLKRSDRADRSRLRPDDYLAINRQLRKLIQIADTEWNKETAKAWTHFFAERERVLIPLLLEAVGRRPSTTPLDDAP